MIHVKWRWLNGKIFVQAFTNNPTNLNLTNVRILRAKARQTIKQNRSHCWRSFISKLNSQTPMIQIWQLIRRISVNSTPAAKSPQDQQYHNIPTEIANIIASTTAHNSSSDHNTDSFQRLKSRQENREINFSSNNSE